MKLEKFKNLLESKYMVVAILFIGFFGWILNIPFISVPILAVIVSLIFILCNDVKNTFAAIIHAPYFFNDINASLVLFIISICLVVSSIIYFIIKNLIKNKEITKGKMFWAFVISTIAFLLGGIYKNFNLLSFLITLGISIICYVLYWICINFTNNFKTFLFNLFICSSIFISLQIVSSIIATGNILQAISSRQVVWIGLQNVNAACVYLTLGIISCFSLGYKTKRDWLYFLLSLLFALIIFVTYCRIMLLLSAITLLVLFIIMFIKSQNKKIFLMLLGFAFVCIAIFWIIKPEVINKLIQSLLSRGISLNGRDQLWPWCWNKFKEFPIFGIGFYSLEEVPTTHVFHNLVSAHNTLLQWLTSLGIVGTFLMTFFYYKKYQIIFKSGTFSNFFLIISIIMIELNGIVDQAAIMDTFIYIISLILIASVEKENNKPQQLQQTKLQV